MTPATAKVMQTMQAHLDGAGVYTASHQCPARTGNPHIITSMSGSIQNLTPWKGEHGGDGDTSGYTASMADAVWWDSATRPDERVWTQTFAEELLRDARDYFDQVIANVSEQDSQTDAFARWRSNFMDATKNLQWKINGEHRDVGPFAPDAVMQTMQAHLDGAGVYTASHQCTTGPLFGNSPADSLHQDGRAIPKPRPSYHPRPSLEDRIEALYQERALISQKQLFASVGDPLTYGQTFAHENAKEELFIIDNQIRSLQQQLYEIQNAEQIEAERKYNTFLYSQSTLQQLLQDRQASFEFGQ